MNRSTVTFGVAILLCATCLFYLQATFDRSDHEKGERLVRHMKTPGRSEPFETFLANRHNGQVGTWKTEITGGCRGVVHVTYAVPGTPPTLYGWDVEIPSQAVHPRTDSPTGERALKDFAAVGPALPPLELPPPGAPPPAAPPAGNSPTSRPVGHP